MRFLAILRDFNHIYCLDELYISFKHRQMLRDHHGTVPCYFVWPKYAMFVIHIKFWVS